MNSPLIKVCGMRSPENVQGLIRLNPDFIGLIFHPASPRYVSDPESLRPIFSADRKFKLVGVFVNDTLDEILRLHRLLSFDFVQLHGQESPEFALEVRQYGIEIIKAYGIRTAGDFAKCADFREIATYNLFDYLSAAHGGTGNKFDWSLLSHYKEKTPFLLSGGIRPEDSGLPEHPGMAGIDINSRFEHSPGLKDLILIERIIKKFK